MTKNRPNPAATPQAEADRQARISREAEALRANLRRRKAQSRLRQDSEIHSAHALDQDYHESLITK
jgi:hypothetical protein